MRVQDALLEGEGQLSARLLGLVPMASASGPQATRGELMRYLAELAWCPDAILHNRSIEWEVVSTTNFVATARLGPVTASVHIEVDVQSRIAGISAPARPRSVGKSFIDTPWWGRFGDFRTIEGRQIPFIGEVGWELEGERVTVWEGHLLDWSVG